MRALCGERDTTPWPPALTAPETLPCQLTWSPRPSKTKLLTPGTLRRTKKMITPEALVVRKKALYYGSPQLSPIIEQSPPDGLPETGAECSMRAQGFAEQGTIVGEGLAQAQRSLATCSVTEVQHHAPAALSFRDQTAPLAHTEVAMAKSPPSKASKPDWDVYVSPEQSSKPACPLPQCDPVAEAFLSKSHLCPQVQL
ncbi:hypothetical protein J4Q44_G00343040 [Coregonus suidteri]|uniref:Uncharacterized protein n=1 Tax=Coregonus suidteri TaxID=861788 RepID=A0AAN8KPM3_9TELE